jgi:hypothetical protein
MEQPDSEKVEAGPVGAGSMQEGASISNPSLSDSVQTLRSKPAASENISLDLLVSLDEPGLLMLALKMIAAQKYSREWQAVHDIAKDGVDRLDLLNQPKPR